MLKGLQKAWGWPRWLRPPSSSDSPHLSHHAYQTNLIYLGAVSGRKYFSKLEESFDTMKVEFLKKVYNKKGILFCCSCEAEYSANPSDYFLSPPDKELTCCEEPLVPVVKEVFFKKIDLS